MYLSSSDRAYYCQQRTFLERRDNKIRDGLTPEFLLPALGVRMDSDLIHSEGDTADDLLVTIRTPRQSHSIQPHHGSSRGRGGGGGGGVELL